MKGEVSEVVFGTDPFLLPSAAYTFFPSAQGLHAAFPSRQLLLTHHLSLKSSDSAVF